MAPKPRVAMFNGWWCCGIVGPNFKATHARTPLRAFELYWFYRSNNLEVI